MTASVLQEALCAGLEKLANQATRLYWDRDATLQPLAGTSLAITLKELGRPVQISVDGSNIAFYLPDEPNADCHLITDLETLPKLQNKHQLTQFIQQGKLDIEGDLDIAQKYASLADERKIDIEEWLSGIVGDGMAFKLAQTGRNLKQSLSSALKRGQTDINDYLTDEANLAPRRREYQYFVCDVDDVSMAVDRLDLRLKQLEADS